MLYGSQAVVPASFSRQIIARLQDSHGGIEGTKSWANQVVQWRTINSTMKKCDTWQDILPPEQGTVAFWSTSVSTIWGLLCWSILACRQGLPYLHWPFIRIVLHCWVQSRLFTHHTLGQSFCTACFRMWVYWSIYTQTTVHKLHIPVFDSHTSVFFFKFFLYSAGVLIIDCAVFSSLPAVKWSHRSLHQEVPHCQGVYDKWPEQWCIQLRFIGTAEHPRPDDFLFQSAQVCICISVADWQQ